MIAHQPLYRIGPSDRALADEFRRSPLGPYRPDLLRLLSRLRWEPLHGKHVLVCTKRHREWVLGRVSAVRGEPIELLTDHVFDNRAAAEWAVFKIRWRNVTGQPLDLD